MTWEPVNPKDLPVCTFEAKCPTCDLTQFPLFIEATPQMLHIPPRYALMCHRCHTPWYIVQPDFKETQNDN